MPANRARALLASSASIATAIIGVLANDGSGSDAVLTIVVVAIVASSWQLVRIGFESAQIHLATIGAGLIAAAGMSTVYFQTDNGLWGDFLAESRIELIRDTKAATMLYIVAIGVVMVATANAVVRVVLDVVIDGDPPTTRIRGGRVIGPLERLLIIGFVVAGQPMTAALVVTAKSLLRYPELRSHDDVDMHAVTEYVLIGSLMSWAIALAATIPLL
ncbi:MAG: hypothetical protein P8J50_08970 [Acidimicrobiales bacterium]|jgi:hypothetical protein|nr:hypothetical protein [Acidimicrobiales bacterium]